MNTCTAKIISFSKWFVSCFSCLAQGSAASLPYYLIGLILIFTLCKPQSQIMNGSRDKNEIMESEDQS